jgi:uncharacterized protein (UPF0332 family)
MSDSYMGMAEESIRVIDRMEQSRIWTATASYYIFYYSLYALMLRIGIKSEIHSCSIAFMEKYLSRFYDSDDVSMMKRAFSARINLQYYANRPVDEDTISQVKGYCKRFFLKTRDILVRIKESDVYEIRESLKGAKR